MIESLSERRARFVYEGGRLAAEAAGAPIIPDFWDDRGEAFWLQFTDAVERQCGPDRATSPQFSHGRWMQSYLSMGWVYGEEYDREKKVHPDLVPYSKLGQLERNKDAVFIALCEIARLYVYDPLEESEL